MHGPASYAPRAVARWLLSGSVARLSAVAARYRPDAAVLAERFQLNFGRPINWRAPMTFNEKIFWIMRYVRDPLLPRLADKVTVRDYVRDRVGAGALTDLYGVWATAAAIPFDTLPTSFVLKLAGGSGTVLICRDRATFDVAAARTTCHGWLTGPNFYWRFREWAYKPSAPRVLAEELLLADGHVPHDYKFFCFDGVPRLVQVHRGRFTHHTSDMYTPDWDAVPVRRHFPRGETPVPCPPALEAMLAMARALSAGLPFVRVDLYALDATTVKFSEMTWYPDAGNGIFEPDWYDGLLGSWLRLPDRWGRFAK
jgi:hypothetical protein